MICTARETAAVRRKALNLGITQLDASSNVGIGAYVAEGGATDQEAERQQFMLGDTRGLAEVIRELAESGSLTSFCTAGYRCGRTGKCIMDLLRKGMEGKFCKLNAVLTFREYIDDFGTPELRSSGEGLIEREMKEIAGMLAPEMVEVFKERYERTCRGERDLYF
jgi:2-iminoacetate synthase